MFKKIALMSFGVLLAGVASAEGGLYGGVGVGLASTSINNQNVVTGATAYSFSKDETDTAYKLQAGYQVNNYFAIEGGYVNLGKFSATENVTAPANGSVKGRSKVQGWSAFAVGILPIAQGFSAFGKLGTIYSTTKTHVTTGGAVVLAAGQSANRSRSEFNLAYGLGLQYDITKTMNVRAEWERFEKVGNNASNGTGERDFNIYSVGLNYRF